MIRKLLSFFYWRSSFKIFAIVIASKNPTSPSQPPAQLSKNPVTKIS
ncbi:hypothetical protein [Nostoc sp. UHCC 0252]|nr:hypothetical protein [Nostoc sp. UHCC 0252]MEA5603397.1 hypothetical protein [Nostoc sp. UHCC 0252]